MTCAHRLSSIVAMPLFWIVVALLPSMAAAANPQSMQSFLEFKDKWPDLIGTSFHVEGHYTIATRNYVKLKHCELTFRSAKPLPTLRGSSKVVEIFGRLAKETDTGKLYFEIEQLKELPTDLATFQVKDSALSRAKAKDWYELGEWAKSRGKFYEDPELLKRADTANRKGLNLERDELSVITPESLRGLAARAQELELGDALKMELIHESLWLEWETLLKKIPKLDPAKDDLDVAKDPLFAFLKRIDAELPGATARPAGIPLKVAEDYRRHSVISYRLADEPTRRVMHRLFHLEVARSAIARTIRPDGSNGSEVADRIDELTPEDHDSAEKHRDAELAFQVQNVVALSRSQVQDLALRCRERKQDRLADDAIARWLARREQSLRKDGITGLLQLSDERWGLTQDLAAASAPLLEAQKEAPTNAQIIERLQNLGFQEVDGKWRHPQLAMPKAAAAPLTESELDRNIRAGIPSVGMTPAQLLRCLGTPSSVTRFGTSGRTTEVWTYRESGAVRHSATIERRTSRGDATVIAIQ